LATLAVAPARKLKRMWETFSQNSVRRDTGLLAIGSTGAQIVQGIGTLLLGRLYTPAAFGVWFLVQSIAAFGSASGGLRYELAIPLVDRDEDALPVIALQAVCSFATTAISVLVLVLWHKQIAVWLGAPDLAVRVAAVPLIILLTALGASATYWFLRTKQFATLAKSRILMALGGVGLQAVLAPMARGNAGGLIIGSTAGLAVPVVMFAHALKSRMKHVLQVSVDPARLSSAAKKHSAFPKYVVPYGFIGIVRDRGLVMLFAAYASMATTGFYALALRVVNAPFTLLYGSLSPVLYQRAVAEPDREKVAFLIYRTLKILVTVSTPAFIAFAWFAPVVFTSVLGPRWKGAGAYAAVLIAPAYTLALQGLFDRMFDLVGRQRLALIIEICYTIAGLTAFAVTVVITRDTLIALVAFSAVSIVYHVVWITQVYRVMKFPQFDLVKILIRAAILGAVSYAILGALRSVGVA